MNTIISNKIFVYNPSYELRQWVLDNLVVENPKYNTLMRIGKQDQIIRYHIEKDMALFVYKNDSLILPFGVLPAVWKFIKNGTFTPMFNDNTFVSNKNEKITQPLYDYQEIALKRMLEAKSGVLVGGCGSGKTNIGIAIAHSIGKRTLWLCHTKDLLKQTVKRIKFLYPNTKVGTITEGKVDIGEFTVSTIQTLVNIDSDLYSGDFDVVIADECHHVNASPTLLKQFGKVIEKIPARYKFGLTATPSRQDGLIKTMYTLLSCNESGEFAPVYEIPKSATNTLVAEHRKVELNTPFSYDMLNEDGSFNYSGLIDYLSTNKERNEEIIKNVLEMAENGRKQLILCSRVDHCELLYNKLAELGKNVVLLVGKVSAKKRDDILSEKKNWDIIVATQSLAKEGLDVPSLDTIHLAMVCKDKAQVVQSVGRIERVMAGKKDPIALDYVDIKIPYCVSAYHKRKNYLKSRLK